MAHLSCVQVPSSFCSRIIWIIVQLCITTVTLVTIQKYNFAHESKKRTCIFVRIQCFYVCAILILQLRVSADIFIIFPFSRVCHVKLGYLIRWAKVAFFDVQYWNFDQYRSCVSVRAIPDFYQILLYRTIGMNTITFKPLIYACVYMMIKWLLTPP